MTTGHPPEDVFRVVLAAARVEPILEGLGAQALKYPLRPDIGTGPDGRFTTVVFLRAVGVERLRKVAGLDVLEAENISATLRAAGPDTLES